MNEETIARGEVVVRRAQNKPPETFYEPRGSRYWLRDKRDKFMPYPVHHLRARLGQLRLTKAEIGEHIYEIQYTCAIDCVLPIAGLSQGIHESDGKRILCPTELKRLTPRSGKWEILGAVLDNLLGSEQKEWFLGWLSVWAKAFHDYAWAPGQVLVLVGPAGAGKSLLQRLLDYLFGDCRANPLPWMTGRSNHNGELVGVSHLCIEDEFADSSKAIKDALRENAKAIAVNESHRIRPMYAEAFNAKPLWRLTISANPSDESMGVIPPVDPHTQNKLALLWCNKASMPMPTQTHLEKQAFMGRLKAEMPMLLNYLLNEHVITEELSCPEQRMGVRGYHHPKALLAAESCSFEGRRMEMVVEVLQRWGDKDINAKFDSLGTSKGTLPQVENGKWRGTPSDLLQILSDHGLKGDFRTANSLGKLLANRSRLPSGFVIRHADRTYSVDLDAAEGAQAL